MHKAKCKMHNWFFLLCILHFALCISSCSVPNLEKPQCTAARDAVKRFYSFHFGNDIHPSLENLKARDQFLTTELVTSLSKSNETATDYFTSTEDYPKAFRVGECTAESGVKVTLQVLLLWRDDIRNDQKEVKVEAVKTADKWLINKVVAEARDAK
jgi:hypothetical protein